ncbi:isochorismatase family protein [Furfurilactobacillus sp. WILCCON 0119]
MNQDVVSPITDKALEDRQSAEEAKAAGNFVHSKPTPENSILLLIDHQTGLLSSTRHQSLSELKNNIVGLGRIAKAMNIPTMLATSNAQWQNSDLIPELKAVFPDNPIYRRTGIINAYEDPSFRSAFEKIVDETKRTHIIIAAVTIGTCCTFPTLSMLNDGYKVFPVIDACGAWNSFEFDAASSRMANAGAELETVFSLAAELQADWKLPTAEAALAPFVDNLPEYGYVIDSFNANVANPFKEG